MYKGESIMLELTDRLDLEAYHLHNNTPGCNRKQRIFFYPVEIYDAFMRLHETGMQRPTMIVASMLKYIKKIETQGFEPPSNDVEMKPYILYAKTNYGKRISAYLSTELVERFENLDVPTNKRLTYAIAMYEYLLSKGINVE